MAQQISNYFANLIMDQWFGKSATPTVPTTYYVCMFTTTPGLADSGGVEVTGSGYVRLALPNDTSHFAASANRIKNAAGSAYPLAWFTASGTLGPIVATGIRDAATGGNLIMLYDIPGGNQGTLVSGNQITFAATDFTFQIV